MKGLKQFIALVIGVLLPAVQFSRLKDPKRQLSIQFTANSTVAERNKAGNVGFLFGAMTYYGCCIVYYKAFMGASWCGIILVRCKVLEIQELLYTQKIILILASSHQRVGYDLSRNKTIKPAVLRWTLIMFNFRHNCRLLTTYAGDVRVPLQSALKIRLYIAHIQFKLFYKTKLGSAHVKALH